MLDLFDSQIQIYNYTGKITDFNWRYPMIHLEHAMANKLFSMILLLVVLVIVSNIVNSIK